MGSAAASRGKASGSHGKATLFYGLAGSGASGSGFDPNCGSVWLCQGEASRRHREAAIKSIPYEPQQSYASRPDSVALPYDKGIH